MILSFLFYFFLCYLLFRLVFNFLIPLYKTTKKVRRGFQEMQDQMNGQSQAYSANGAAIKEEKKPNLDNVGEYIDFEDVK